MKEAWFCDGARGDLRGERHVRGWIIAAAVADALLILIHLALCFTFDGAQVSDAESYLELARYYAMENSWYPGPGDLYATYIFGNGYVNLLSVVMRLSTDMIWAFLLNMLFAQMIVLSWADIAGQLTGRTQTACLTVVLLCTMCGLWGEAVATRTELCFMAFMGVSLALSLRKNAGALFAAGALMALANWVRPLLVVFLPGVLLFFLRIPVLSLYDLRPETREMADHFLMILSVVCMGMSYQMPTNGGIIRGGGSSMFVVKEDLISIWGIVVPLSLIMAFVVKASPEVVVICLNADQVFKCLPAYLKANHGNWIKKLA